MILASKGRYEHIGQREERFRLNMQYAFGGHHVLRKAA
jgi:hypothetical protein